MTEEHTQGPWIVPADFAAKGLIDSPFGSIAQVLGYNNMDDETIPNAKLIAAAPELLDACRVAFIYSGNQPAVQERLRTALIKATGRVV